MSDNTPAFDPYHQWLGLPRHTHPPDHYTLLGLAELEDDLGRIAQAAEARLAQLERIQDEERLPRLKGLEQEIQRARQCLLSPERKAAYDQRLRESRSSRQARAQRQPGVFPIFRLLGLAFASFLVALVYFNIRQQPLLQRPDVPVVVDEEPLAQQQREIESPPDPSDRTPSIPPVEPAPVLPPVETSSMDLLSMVDLDRDVLSGMWRREGGRILEVMPRQREAVLEVHREMPENFEIRLRVQVPPDSIRGPSGQGLILGMVSQGRRFNIVIDKQAESGEYVSGIGRVNGHPLEQNITARHGRLLYPGSTRDFVVQVRGDQIRVTCDYQPVIDWQDGWDRLSTQGRIETREDDRMFVAAQGPGSIRISQMWLRPLEVDASGSLGEALPGNPVAGLARPQPVPSDERREFAKQKMDHLLQNEIADTRTSADRLALARRWVEMAPAIQDPTARFVLLSEARRLAIEDGDVEAALSAVAKMGSSFAVDDRQAKIDAIMAAEKSARGEEQRSKISKAAMGVAADLMAADQFDQAVQMYDLAATTAGDAEYAREIRRLRTEAGWLKQQWQATRQALKTISLTHDNPQANLTAGTYFALIKGQWDVGLPYLIKSHASPLTTAAKLDVRSPVAPLEQVAVGEAWLRAANVLQRGQKTRAEERAAHWFAKAQPNLNEPTRQKLTQTYGPVAAGLDSQHLNSPQHAAGLAVRNRRYRSRLLEQYGGSQQTEAAASRAIAWLIAQQQPDGSWPSMDVAGTGGQRLNSGYGRSRPSSPGMTALVLLTIMGDPQAAASQPAQRGARYLMGQLNHPQFSAANTDQDLVESRALMASALAEMYAFTGEPKIATAAKRALAGLQLGNGVTFGRNYRSMHPELATTFALRTADWAGLMEVGIEGQTSPGAGSNTRHTAFYRGPTRGRVNTSGDMYLASVTALREAFRSNNMAVGDQSTTLHQIDPTQQTLVNLASRLARRGPTKNAAFDYAAAQVLFQAGGPAWSKWNRRWQEQTLKSQTTRGREAGSWDWQGNSTAQRILQTSLITQTLQIYYRHPRRQSTGDVPAFRTATP